MDKVTAMQEILEQLRVPTKQQNERTALIMLALAGLTKKSKWKDTTENYYRTHDLRLFINENYDKTYKENTRETFRKDSLKPLCNAAIIETNGVITNSPKTAYRLTRETARLLRSYGTDHWEDELKEFQETHKTLEAIYDQKKLVEKTAFRVNETPLVFKTSPHNRLQKAVLEEFIPRFAGEKTQLLYVGDTADRNLYFDKEKIKKLNIDVFENAALPDIVVYDPERDWVYFIEAVTSVGPMSPERVHNIKKYCENCTSGLIFVTAFQTMKKYKEFISDVAWDTEIWIAEMPDHMIHLNGDRFMGPR